jgi:hypothetical protein
MLADLYRRLLTRIFNVRWRLTVHFHIEADVTSRLTSLHATRPTPRRRWKQRCTPPAPSSLRCRAPIPAPRHRGGSSAWPSSRWPTSTTAPPAPSPPTTPRSGAAWLGGRLHRRRGRGQLDGRTLRRRRGGRREQLQRIHAGHGVCVMSPARRFGLVSLVAADAVWVLRRFRRAARPAPGARGACPVGKPAGRHPTNPTDLHRPPVGPRAPPAAFFVPEPVSAGMPAATGRSG